MMSICNLLKNYLAAKNYETSLYINGGSALDAFSENYSTCASYIMMPEMDGLTLLKRCGKFASAHHIPYCQKPERRYLEGFKAEPMIT